MDDIREISQNRSKGKIFLHSLPGHHENLEETIKSLKKFRITKIFCLSEIEEIISKSPEYFKSVENYNIFGIDIVCNPVMNYSIPVSTGELSFYQTSVHSLFLSEIPLRFSRDTNR